MDKVKKSIIEELKETGLTDFAALEAVMVKNKFKIIIGMVIMIGLFITGQPLFWAVVWAAGFMAVWTCGVSINDIRNQGWIDRGKFLANIINSTIGTLLGALPFL